MSVGDFLDFGDLKPDDIRRILSEQEAQGVQRYTLNEKTLHGASAVTRGFLMFVYSVLHGLGLLERARVLGCPIGVMQEFQASVPVVEMMRELWNARAKEWAVVESPHNYRLTMQTLLEFFKVNDRQKKETILSLGSGPGLYETYLGSLLQSLPRPKVTIYSVDSAPEMTACHQRILAKSVQLSGGAVRNVRPVTEDMLNLKFKDESVDQIICNNALQWTTDWRAAIAEMARVMRPHGLGRLHLFVHAHPMAVFNLAGQRVVELGKFELSELLDELEQHRFVIDHIRHLASMVGMGQAGSAIRRSFILARLQVGGERRRWRNAKVASALTGVRVDS